MNKGNITLRTGCAPAIYLNFKFFNANWVKIILNNSPTFIPSMMQKN